MRSTVTFALATNSACTVVMLLIPWHRKAVYDFVTIRCVIWHTRFRPHLHGERQHGASMIVFATSVLGLGRIAVD